VVLAVIATCLFFPTGIPAIVYAYQARSRKNAGNYRGAVKVSKLARLYIKASFVIWIVMLGLTGLAWLAGFRGSG
jgi:hypothetical protein